MKKRMIKNLSKGYKQRVGLAEALIGDPEVLILDEPTVGLDPKQIIDIRNVIKEIGKERTIILSTHILQEVNAVCDRVTIISHGKIVAQNTLEGLEEETGGKDKFLLKTLGNSENAYNVLSGMEEILSVEKVSFDENDAEFIIVKKPDCDIFENLTNLFAKNSIAIKELRSAALSLEEIFIKLTTQESVEQEEPVETKEGEENESNI